MVIDCKHVSVRVDEVVEVSVKGHKWCGANTICYLSVCSACAKTFDDMGLLAHTDEERDKWVRVGSGCCGVC